MLADEYRRQAAWRSWNLVLDALPALAGETVLDLGCAVGDQAALLAARGARVLGVDNNGELLAIAGSRNLRNVEFRKADLQFFMDPGEPFDGLWCSFTAAYFTDLSDALRNWTTRLRPGGWVALTEIDNLFGHEPVDRQTRRLLDAYADEAFAAARYDFRMGRRLASHLEAAGFAVTKVMRLEDLELNFDGPARSDVLDAWRARLDRMKLLRDFCGGDYELVRDDFLQCLTLPGHRSDAKVWLCVGER